MVDTGGDAVFLLGRTTSNHFTYRARIRLKKEWRHFGLVWGHGKKQRAHGPAEEKANLVLVTNNEGQLRVKLVELRFADIPRKRISGNAFPINIEHDVSPTELFDLEIELRDGVEPNLTIQGQEIQGIKTPNKLFQEGGLGLFFCGGDFTVTEAWYQNKENGNAAKVQQTPAP
jgi:hypothetical protein